MTKKLALLLVLPALLLLSACQGTLETGGAYAPATTNATTGVVTPVQAPDMGLYVADGSFKIAYSTVQTALKLERDNRAFLWSVDPNIKHTVDGLRPKIVDAVKRYGIARKAYKANPTPAGLDQLHSILGEMNQIAAAAQTVTLPLPTPTK